MTQFLIIPPLLFYLFLSLCSCSFEEEEPKWKAKRLKQQDKDYLVWAYTQPYGQKELAPYLDLKEEETKKSVPILEIAPFSYELEEKPLFLDQNSDKTLKLFKLSFPDQVDASKVLSLLQKEKNILFFEEDRENSPILYPFKKDHSAQASSKWWFDEIGCSKSTNLHDEIRTSDNPPVIAVLDSGIDTAHPYLASYLWENKTPGSFGCQEDRWGCDTSAHHMHGPAFPHGLKKLDTSCKHLNTTEAQLSCNHGTHLAGLIVGVAKEGFASQKPPYLILNIKVVTEKEGTAKVSDSAVLRALNYIRRLKEEGHVPLKIVNLSFGKPERSASLSFFIDYLTKAHPDLLLVAAAGNEQKQRPFYPAAESAVLAVTALSSLQEKASYANYGSWVDLSAPGGDQSNFDPQKGILSSVPGGGFALSRGTSMAAPFVSGVAALVAAKHPNWTAKETSSFLKKQALSSIYEKEKNRAYQPVIFPENKKIPLLGAGLLNASSLFSKKDALSLDAFSPETNPTERIENSCASLGVYKDRSSMPMGFILYFFLIPLILAISYSVQKICRLYS